MSYFAQSIDIFINFFEHLKHYFRSDEMIYIYNLINVNMFDCFVVRSLNYINCFHLFRIEMIFIYSKLIHHVKILIFEHWIVVFDKHDKIRKFRWFLICHNEWRKKFSKFLSKSRQINFERHIFILLFHKRFFQFTNLFFVNHYFFLKWCDFIAQIIFLVFYYYTAFLCLNNYLKNILLFLF